MGWAPACALLCLVAPGVRLRADALTASHAECVQKDGERKPTKKGIMLTASEWSALAGGLPTLQEAQARGESPSNVIVPLSTSRRASLFAAKSGLLVDVREWYDKDGEQKPGSKGVSLSSAELQVSDNPSCVPGVLTWPVIEPCAF